MEQISMFPALISLAYSGNNRTLALASSTISSAPFSGTDWC
jgi:hypothetical protein